MNIDRRTVLASTSTLGAAWLIGVPAALRPSANRRAIRKALKIGMIKDGKTLLEKFQVAREAGFEGVELDSPADLDPKEVAAAKQATGLEVPGIVDSVHWKHTLSDADAAVREKGRQALETALRDAKACGASTVLLVPAVVNERVSYADAYERSQAEIRRVLPLAKELDVQIAIENVWNGFLLSPLEAARYIDEFEHSHIGWYLDVGNLVNFGWPDQWARILGKRVLKLDVKGFSKKKRDDEGLWRGFDAPIGEDDCRWKEVMAALDEVGFQGWASAEVGGGNVAHLADVATRMQRVLEA